MDRTATTTRRSMHGEVEDAFWAGPLWRYAGTPAGPDPGQALTLSFSPAPAETSKPSTQERTQWTAPGHTRLYVKLNHKRVHPSTQMLVHKVRCRCLHACVSPRAPLRLLHGSGTSAQTAGRGTMVDMHAGSLRASGRRCGASRAAGALVRCVTLPHGPWAGRGGRRARRARTTEGHEMICALV